MRILFSMKHTGHIRNYQSTLCALLEQGHDVHLLFRGKDKPGGEPMVADLLRTYPRLTLGRFTHADDPLYEPFIRAPRIFSDYLRYIVPPYENSPVLRARVAELIPPLLTRLIDRLFAGRPHRVRRARRAIVALDRVVPPDPRVEKALEAYHPDVVLVTPYVDLGSSQADFIKSARALGIPSALCVSSWDNLTNKGLIRIVPDMVIVWNERQKQEAVDLHHIDASRVRVTGAQPYDQWFSWRPSRTREAFCEEVGLHATRPFLVYLCSSAQIAPNEVDFVRQWIAALRASPDPSISKLGALVRPHPYHVAQWQGVDLSDLGNATIWPVAGENPVDVSSKSDYFDSLFYSAAAVGVNTSGLIEAGVLSRPVFTIKTAAFAGSQDGTLHFRHLVEAGGGLLHVAHDFDEHVEQVRAMLSSDGTYEAFVVKNANFLRSFVRPHGLDEPATPRLVAAILELGGERRVPMVARWYARAAGRSFAMLGSFCGWLLLSRRPRARAVRRRRVAVR